MHTPTMEKSALRRPWTRWAAIAGGVVLLLIAAAWMSNGVLSRIARERAVHALQDKFASNLEMNRLDVSVFPQLHMSGEGLALHYHGRKDVPPLISIRKFTANASLAALLFGHVRQVRLEGLEIQVPPKSERGDDENKSDSKKIDGFVIDEIIADGTVLKTLPKDPDKEPLEWDIRRLTLHGAGPDAPLTFHATLVNAKPPGDIESDGKFGPWHASEPGDTPVEGSTRSKRRTCPYSRALREPCRRKEPTGAPSKGSRFRAPPIRRISP